MIYDQIFHGERLYSRKQYYYDSMDRLLRIESQMNNQPDYFYSYRFDLPSKEIKVDEENVIITKYNYTYWE